MRPILIIVAGGTASGKTTVVNKVIDRLNTNDVTVIPQDNYYKDLSNLQLADRKKVNYDHPDSFDMDLLYLQLKSLIEDGKNVEMPLYDFCEHNRRHDETITLKPTKVIILEGILALYDARIRSLSDIEIFVESDDDTRFIRRLLRDIKERGRTMDDVIKQYTETVKPMYHSYIKPTKRYADIIIPNDQKHEVAVDFIIARIEKIVRGA